MDHLPMSTKIQKTPNKEGVVTKVVVEEEEAMEEEIEEGV